MFTSCFSIWMCGKQTPDKLQKNFLFIFLFCCSRVCDSQEYKQSQPDWLHTNKLSLCGIRLEKACNFLSRSPPSVCFYSAELSKTQPGYFHEFSLKMPCWKHKETERQRWIEGACHSYRVSSSVIPCVSEVIPHWELLVSLFGKISALYFPFKPTAGLTYLPPSHTNTHRQQGLQTKNTPCKSWHSQEDAGFPSSKQNRIPSILAKEKKKRVSPSFLLLSLLSSPLSLSLPPLSLSLSLTHSLTHSHSFSAFFPQ